MYHNSPVLALRYGKEQGDRMADGKDEALLSQIQDALKEIGRGFDSRTMHCQVTAVSAAAVDSHLICQLAGTVLDTAVLTAVLDQLATHFPRIQFDTQPVTILRRPDAEQQTVCTNLAGLHVRPSRTSEMVSELLNGCRVTRLQDEGEWAYIQQEDGYLGWAHTAYLGDWPQQTPTHLVGIRGSLLYAQPDAQASLISQVLGGTAVQVETSGRTASHGWARLTLAGGKAGWVPQDALRAFTALPQDENGRRQQMISDARCLIGTPYRWGGCTGLGIDCSGLSQLVHWLAGITLPRDADMQFAAGRPIEPPFLPGDLLFFGSKQSHRPVSHVGISVGGWHIIHASGPRNGVYEDEVTAVDWLRTRFLGACTFIT